MLSSLKRWACLGLLVCAPAWSNQTSITTGTPPLLSLSDVIAAPPLLATPRVIRLPAAKPLKTLRSTPAIVERIVQHYKIPRDQASAIVTVAHQVGAKNNLDPLLLLSVMATESSFNPTARSHSGAMGLMQAIPRWHGDKMVRLGMSHDDIYDIHANVNLGALILKDYIRQSKGDVAQALQRYNGSLNDKSRSYSNKVLREYALISRRSV